MQVQAVASQLTKRCIALGLKAETFEEERAIGFLFEVFHIAGTKIIIETVDGELTELSINQKER